MGLLSGLIILLVSVLVHEFGHFLAARLCGVGIVTFSAGFGPRLWKKRIGNTFYCLSLLPLGGYVLPLARSKRQGGKENSDAAFLDRFLMPLGKDEEALAEELAARGNRSLEDKGFFVRLAVYAAGVILNLTLFCLCIIYAVSLLPHYDELVGLRVGKVRFESQAYKAGIRAGDVILKVEGKRLSGWPELWNMLRRAEGRALHYEIQSSRNRSEAGLRVFKLSIPADVRTVKGHAGNIYSMGLIPAKALPKLGFKRAASLSWQFIKKAVDLLFASFTPSVESVVTALDNLNGPLSGLMELGDSANDGIIKFLIMVLSINLFLAVFNILPIPALDGGAIAMLFVELLRGSPFSPLVKQRINSAALACFLLFFVALAFKDVLG